MCKPEKAQLELLQSLARAAEGWDNSTEQHLHRVGRLSAAIARSCDLPQRTAALIGQAATLHDVGKIGIPERILQKPGPLSPEEVEVLKTHPALGAHLLRGGTTPLMRLAHEIALTHHERWDGGGYPHGLAGDAIPLSGRIVAVADMLDSLTRNRPSKAAWPLQQAVLEIRAQAGRHFDPAVVAAFERSAPALPGLGADPAPAPTAPLGV
ncbi:HD domain-containing protein (plasmid) [Deinococcus taeanensis]|uniref:HD-GYP domain-containing protein n=1 Tax=Deinococcus taeanensis TaxID=2737050 RepID=UPI001CDC14BA|nr:HD domain-containing phosphohydrolase [Deinococcus taeanensis]UBV44610.1 HD domain-containing protein [Deinococcus taeanensis]